MKSASGFTLIEVMVALMIFAIVSVLAAQGLKTLIRSHEIIKTQSDNLAQLQMAYLLLERNLTQAQNRPITDEKNIRQPAMLGTQTYIEFTHSGNINPQGNALRSTLQRTAYFLNPQGEFIQRNWSVLDRPAKTVFNDRVLVSHVNQLSYRYIGAKNQYYNTWPPLEDKKQTGLPRAVQITLDLGHAGKVLYVLMVSHEKK